MLPCALLFLLLQRAKLLLRPTVYWSPGRLERHHESLSSSIDGTYDDVYALCVYRMNICNVTHKLWIRIQELIIPQLEDKTVKMSWGKLTQDKQNPLNTLALNILSGQRGDQSPGSSSCINEWPSWTALKGTNNHIGYEKGFKCYVEFPDWKPPLETQ